MPKADLAEDLAASEAVDTKLQLDDAPNQDEVKVTVTLQARHAKYLEALAAGMSMERGEAVSIDRCVEILIRQKYALDPTKGGLVHPQSSGPRKSYNAVTGAWN